MACEGSREYRGRLMVSKVAAAVGVHARACALAYAMQIWISQFCHGCAGGANKLPQRVRLQAPLCVDKAQGLGQGHVGSERGPQPVCGTHGG